MMKTLFVACRSRAPQTAQWGPVGRLDHAGDCYRFCYTRGALALPGFRPFEEMPDLGEVYESDELFPIFANRLLSPSRPEYDAYLGWLGFSGETPPDPIAILSVTEGLRETDSIEVFPCPVPCDSGYSGKFFLHGVRWLAAEALDRVDRLRPDECLVLQPESGNEFDPHAVAILTEGEGTPIGYVPRYLAGDVRRLLTDCGPESVEVCVQRVNRDAPLQHRVLCRMNACWPEGFRPCSGDAYTPIPENVPLPCLA